EATAATIQSPPAAPTALTATAAPLFWTQINLSWTVTASNATAIEIYRKTGTSASTSPYALVGLVVPTATSFTDNTASAGTTYTYRVRTANNNWPSGYTNEATAATIQSPPAAPSGLTATAAPLFWTQIT